MTWYKCMDINVIRLLKCSITLNVAQLTTADVSHVIITKNILLEFFPTYWIALWAIFSVNTVTLINCLLTL